MSIQTACIFLAILTACSLQWPLYMLPIGAAIPLMITAGAIGFLGILAAVKGLLCFKILYLIGTTLLQIPVFVVIGYTSSALASYDNQCNRCRFPVYYPLGNGYCTDYVTSLCNKTTGFLWSGLIVACISCIFTGISLVGFCKLRIHHQMGATRVVQTDGHHHPQHIVFTPAQPNVYTVPTTTYVTGGVVQQQGAICVALAVDLSAYSIPASAIHPALLSLVDIHRHYQGLDSEAQTSLSERSNSHDLLSFQLSSGRSDSDSTMSPPSTRENVIVKHDSKRKKELVKDDAYWERRKKNNDAAKRSRDSRRQKEDEMASRAAVLERENVKLRGELDNLRAETDQLRSILLTSAAPLALRGLALPPFAPTLLTTASVITPTGHCPLPFPDSTQRGTVLVTNYSHNS